MMFASRVVLVATCGFYPPLTLTTLLAPRCDMHIVRRSARQGCGRHPQACARLAPPPQAERAWYRCWTRSIMWFRYARTEVSLRPWSSAWIRGRTNASLPSYTQAGWPSDGPWPQQEGQRDEIGAQRIKGVGCHYDGSKLGPIESCLYNNYVDSRSGPGSRMSRAARLSERVRPCFSVVLYCTLRSHFRTCNPSGQMRVLLSPIWQARRQILATRMCDARNRDKRKPAHLAIIGMMYTCVVDCNDSLHKS